MKKNIKKAKQIKKAKPAEKRTPTAKKVVAKKPVKATKPAKKPATKLVKPVKPVKPAKLIKSKTKTVAISAPSVTEQPKELKLSKVDSAKYKKLLLDLRDHLIDGVNFLANENLKRSSREATGDLSRYSLHMADAGTDNFDREFALSLVSNEQEALYEIEEALKRLEQSVYGLCGNCEKPIRKERLEAVPFARLCVQCQAGIEKNGRRPLQPVGLFNETTDDDGGESEDSEE
jgi:RNA polymerase-binding transcription factor DksA